MSYYVIGGEYADTTFTELVCPAPVLGPFDAYEQAFVAWRGRAMETIDLAYARFRIVQADRLPRIPASAGAQR